MPLAWVALGSNLGDRETHLRWAIAALRPILTNLRVSRLRETEPVGVPGPQPNYLNAVVVGTPALGPSALLAVLLGLERERGRVRSESNAPRTLDLDLLFYGQQVINEPGLTVPHPRVRERRFVLEPMVDLDPGWVDPVTGRTVAALLAALPVQTTGA